MQRARIKIPTEREGGPLHKYSYLCEQHYANFTHTKQLLALAGLNIHTFFCGVRGLTPDLPAGKLCGQTLADLWRVFGLNVQNSSVNSCQGAAQKKSAININWLQKMPFNK